jgi:sensor histidine kinase regulating citrate/malate metabolism
MMGVSEIRKINSQRKADFDNARDGTFCVLRHGGILIRNGARSKTIDDKAEAAEFLAKVKDKGTGYVKQVVKSYFEQPVAV